MREQERVQGIRVLSYQHPLIVDLFLRRLREEERSHAGFRIYNPNSRSRFSRSFRTHLSRDTLPLRKKDVFCGVYMTCEANCFIIPFHRLRKYRALVCPRETTGPSTFSPLSVHDVPQLILPGILDLSSTETRKERQITPGGDRDFHWKLTFFVIGKQPKRKTTVLECRMERAIA
ncbi:hypothetical protein RB195_013551 [Necator americanus]